MSAGNEREFIDLQQLEERKEQAMKCPLISIGYLASNRIDATKKCECGKEECAWWEKKATCCAVLLIPKHLYTLERMFGLILEKMPHAGQFTK